jgi:pyruvyltransferase
MHGLIVSDCYGIPNIRISASDLVAGGDYKFRDYYSVFNRDRYRVLDVRTDIPAGLLEFVKNGYVDAADEIVEIQGNLMRSFPYASQGI